MLNANRKVAVEKFQESRKIQESGNERIINEEF